MADVCALNQYMYQNNIQNAETFSSNYKIITPAVYEVIRVMDGKPLFLEEHFGRLEASLASIGQKTPFTVLELRSKIAALVEANAVVNHNIKIVINGFDQPEGINFYLFFIPTSYPEESMYRDGVATDLLRAVRNNPHAKIINQSLRDTADALMKEKNLYEAVLVNEEGLITEGSKSNLFFIQDDHVCTSPADGVLLGITRQRIMRICSSNGIPVIEEPVPAENLNCYQAAFISGTSPKVLPISNIGDIKMDPANPLLLRIMQLYNDEIRSYLMM